MKVCEKLRVSVSFLSSGFCELPLTITYSPSRGGVFVRHFPRRGANVYSRHSLRQFSVANRTCCGTLIEFSDTIGRSLRGTVQSDSAIISLQFVPCF
jgi:hypothetical protein